MKVAHAHCPAFRVPALDLLLEVIKSSSVGFFFDLVLSFFFFRSHLAPSQEPKKLVRYRDNQVVTVKGEKYTEVKSKEPEEMKKTYVNIKPARQYRFH
jgi:hypothetical protein